MDVWVMNGRSICFLLLLALYVPFFQFGFVYPYVISANLNQASADSQKNILPINDYSVTNGYDLPPSPGLPPNLADECVPLLNEAGSDCFLTYENNTYGIRMSYPSTWNIYTPKNNPVDNYSSILIVGFEEPLSGAYVLVGVEDIKFEQTPPTYLAKIIQDYRTQVQGFTLISSDFGRTNLVDLPGYEIYYTSTGQRPDTVILTREIGTVIPGTNLAYYVTYSADISEFSKFEKHVQEMANSLNLDLHNVYVAPPKSLADLEFYKLLDGSII